MPLNTVKVKVAVMSNSLRPRGLYSPWKSPGQILEWVAFPCSRGSSQPRDQTQVTFIAGVSHTGKPKNTRVGSLSFLQGISPDPGIRGILHCRRILYQLSREGSPCLSIRRWLELVGKALAKCDFFAHCLFTPLLVLARVAVKAL